MAWKRWVCAILIGIFCLGAGASSAEAPQSDSAAFSASKYWIGVDITNQVVTIYSNSTDRVVRRMICSTGRKATPTPTGTFYLPKKTKSSERSSWYYFSEFNCYARYATRIYGNYLFHSVLYNRKSTSSLSTSSWYNLGSRASHGCVRLLPEDARWIAENCPAGTRCKIYNGKSNPSLTRSLLPGKPGSTKKPSSTPKPTATPKPTPTPEPMPTRLDGETHIYEVAVKSLNFRQKALNTSKVLGWVSRGEQVEYIRDTNTQYCYIKRANGKYGYVLKTGLKLVKVLSPTVSPSPEPTTEPTPSPTPGPAPSLTPMPEFDFSSLPIL